jgi:hypothetical protein
MNAIRLKVTQQLMAMWLGGKLVAKNLTKQDLVCGALIPFIYMELNPNSEASFIKNSN